MNTEIGRIGEEIAEIEIKDRKMKIIEKNYRKKFGEIDIIAKDREGLLIFFEIKTMIDKYGNTAIEPEDNMTSAKIIKLRKICQEYANRNKKLINEERGWRLDLMTIKIPRQMEEGIGDRKLTEIKKNCIIKIYENVA